MPPLCKGRCPAGAEGLSFPAPWMYSAIWQSVATIPHNPSVSFADSSRLEGERSEPEGAAKFILRPGTPARRSRGWGANTQGSLLRKPAVGANAHKNLGHVHLRHRKPATPCLPCVKGGAPQGRRDCHFPRRGCTLRYGKALRPFLTIPQSASLTAPGWRVSAANLKGRQNLFCAPEPQPGEAEDGAQTHKGALENAGGCKRTREPFGNVCLPSSDHPSPMDPFAAHRPSNALPARRVRSAPIRKKKDSLSPKPSFGFNPLIRNPQYAIRPSSPDRPYRHQSGRAATHNRPARCSAPDRCGAHPGAEICRPRGRT